MIIAVTDRSLMADPAEFEQRVLALIESPATFVVLREKDWDSDTLVSFLLSLMGKSDNTCRKIVVHSQVEAARHLGLTYVHLPESRIDEPQKSHTRYSYSVHSVDAIKRINANPVLFTTISPVAPTSCKPGAQPLSEAVLKEALATAKGPLVALGGVNLENAQNLYDMGFRHIALRSQLMLADNPGQLIEQFQAIGF